MKQHVVAIGDDEPVLVMEIIGDPFDESEEAFAPWRDVCAMLDVIWGPETLRSGVVPLVEKRLEGLQHESLVLFLDCLRHSILLRFTLPVCPFRKAHGSW